MKNKTPRDLFIGDIHGMYFPLMSLLNQIDFDPCLDRVWCTGDLVDRGPNPIEVVRLFRDLPCLNAVLGNHDAAFLYRDNPTVARSYEKYQGWISSQGYSTVDLAEAFQYLKALPLTREVELADGRRIGMVHGELPDGHSYSAKASPLKPEHVIDHECSTGQGEMLWGRSMALAAAAAHQFPSGERAPQDWLRLAGQLRPIDSRVDLVISGHTAYLKGPVQLGNHINLDTGGCYEGGVLTVYDPLADCVYQLQNVQGAKIKKIDGMPKVTLADWPELHTAA